MKRLTIRFEDSDYEAIRNEAVNNKKNVSEYIRGEVSNHIEEESEHTESGMVLKGIIDAEALLGMSSDTVKRFEEFSCSDKKSKDSESMLLMFLECARKGKLFPEKSASKNTPGHGEPPARADETRRPLIFLSVDEFRGGREDACEVTSFENGCL